MTAPSVPTSAEVVWHEARAEARSSARALGNAIIGATLTFGVTIAWAASGWVWAAAYAAIWAACIGVVRRLP